MDAPQWQETPAQVATHIAEAFEQSGRVLARFTDEQLNQGFWFLVSNSCSELMSSLDDPALSLSLRLRALRSFVPLFEQVMAARCSPHLSHLDERGANPPAGKAGNMPQLTTRSNWPGLPEPRRPHAPLQFRTPHSALRTLHSAFRTLTPAAARSVAILPARPA